MKQSKISVSLSLLLKENSAAVFSDRKFLSTTAGVTGRVCGSSSMHFSFYSIDIRCFPSYPCFL